MNKHNKEHFRKVKRSKAHNDRMCENMNDDATKDKIFKGELMREEFDNEEVHQFLLFLKRRNVLIVDEEDEIQESKWRK